MRCLLVFAIAAACSTTAHASDTSAGVRISAYVPEICEIDSSTLVVGAFEGTTHGTVFEMCNSGRQFRVIASYRTLGEGEKVQINYGDEVRQLDGSGMSDIAQRSGPTVRNVPIVVHTSGLEQSLAISFGIAVI